MLNVFKYDADYEENEEKYGAIKSELLGDESGNQLCIISCNSSLIVNFYKNPDWFLLLLLSILS